MSHPPQRLPKAVLGAVLGAGLLAAPLTATPAYASPDGQGLVINEAYLKGGSANAPFTHKFVELYNPGSKPVSLSGLYLQYRPATSITAPAASGSAQLTGTVAPQGYFLVQLSSNGAAGAALSGVDLQATGLNPSGGTGTLAITRTADALAGLSGNVAGNANIVDLLGYGTSNTFEGEVLATGGGNTQPDSLQRTGFADSDVNGADFKQLAAITPQGSGMEPGTDPGGETPPVEAGQKSIAEIQGTGAKSPLEGQNVTTRGRVTAVYSTPAGGAGSFNGYYLQTPGTGGAIDPAKHTASDAVFVYSPKTVGQVKIGDYVEVTGKVSEFYEQTQVTVDEGKASVLDDASVATVEPARVAFPDNDAARETLEGMLLAPQGEYTVTNNYDTNYYGQLGLAVGSTPLYNPTVKGKPGSSAYNAEVARAKAASVGLDDGSSLNFNSAANKGTEMPYLSTKNPVRVGAKVTFTAPVILDYRNSEWKFQPTQQLTPANAATVQPATFQDTRTQAPAQVGGDIRLAGFNVLNYFTTLGTDLGGCKPYNDREGNGVTVGDGCNARGAWDTAAFERQQGKIVSAINALGASVVSLEEIENNASVNGAQRDAALAQLVKALNASPSLSGGEWAYVASPAKLPAKEDVIRTAFIYKKDAISTVGESSILTDSADFGNARQPLAQHFKAKGTDTDFLVIANHFKSKGDSSKSAAGDNKDLGDGVGSYNGDRTRQAKALIGFADTVKKNAGTDNVFLIGDFNSYAAEDPIQAILDAGYVNQGVKSGKETYAFGGGIGSLDYVFASPSADALVTGVDEWNINSVESVALEYSRYNYNALNLFDEGPFRSSDHDPVVVGIKTKDAPASETKRLNLLNINDFHGRIDGNTTAFGLTVEQLKAQYPGSTAFLSAGDNIGASLFASSVQQDTPTLEVLNALGLSASATGNHEYDQGADDLTGRVSDTADFPYLAANVTKDGKPILDAYKIVELDGVKVAIIGAITQETPTLVSPGGIKGLEFTDPVEAVNKVAKELQDGDQANGEADVIVAEYHEGTSDSVTNNDTLEHALAEGGVFSKIALETAPEVDVIFNGHTHAQYAWDVAVPGKDGTKRPVLQTGSYGEFIGQVVLEYNPKTGETSTVLNQNVKRVATPSAEQLTQFPAVAKVKTITDAALAKAAEVGNQKVGSATAPITTAMRDGVRDDRASESTLGNFVADALLSKLADADRGGAEIGVVNPGGLRADIAAGDVSYAQANAVLPFLNNLWTTTLTGAQFKTVLEQQWQKDKAGVVPSRPYLQLGLSKNVTYSYDATRADGDRITSIQVNGAPIDPEREYRIGSFSFLLQGGDNFHEFAQGKNTKDTGLVDRDAWIDFIKESGTISPSYDRRAIGVTGLPTGELNPSDSFELSFSKLDLSSTGVPAVTRLTADVAPAAARARSLAAAAAAEPGALGSADVKDGAATLKVTVPSDAAGELAVQVTAQPTGTTLTVPVTVKAASGGDSEAGSDAGAAAGSDAGSNADAGAGADGGADGSDGAGADGSADAGADNGSDAGANADGSTTGGDSEAGAEQGGNAEGSQAGSDASSTGADYEAGAEGTGSDGSSSGSDSAAGSDGSAGSDDGGTAGSSSDGGNGAGENPTDAAPGDELVNTGANTGGWILGGALTLLLGAAALIGARARRAGVSAE